MHTENVVMDRAVALDLYRKYKTHQHYQSEMDYEVQRAYQALAKGRLVIKALESIATAGQKDDGTPKLAIGRADAKVCRLVLRSSGSATMTTSNSWRRPRGDAGNWFDWPDGTFKKPVTVTRYGSTRREFEARLPLVPAYLRPKRGIQNYHVLWEAMWEPVPPRDPMLLRRIGRSDLWVVVAMWDLTEIERGVLATRV
jgi:hypothetical protein